MPGNKHLIRYSKRAARSVLETFSAIRPRHWAALGVRLSDTLSPRTFVEPGREHLVGVIGWLKQAQDVSRGEGCSWGYRARARVRSPESIGWEAPYPETSGYIIETLLRYGHMTGDADAIERARRLADWEVRIQLPDGGVQGGTIGAKPLAGSTFVTGQVLFGWLTGYLEFGRSEYLKAARSAGDYLLSCLDDSGRFVRGQSHFTMPGAKAYETRTGWALALLGQQTGEENYRSAARAIAGFAIRCQQENGWFRENDLSEPAAPLTHAIGYVLEGLLQIGRVLGERTYEEPVRRALEGLRRAIREDGFLAGRLDSSWQPAADWCCLTGSSQLASVLFRMEELVPRACGLAADGDKLLRFVASTQMLEQANPGLRGGIQGSFPFHGGYNPYCMLNWAAKFYADALMDSFDRREGVRLLVS
jgi:hypothetical protein